MQKPFVSITEEHEYNQTPVASIKYRKGIEGNQNHFQLIKFNSSEIRKAKANPEHLSNRKDQMIKLPSLWS
jgi:hypothetical protein